MSEPGDDDFSRAVTELGDPDTVFQVSRRRYLTKLWVGTALVVGSVAAIALFLALGMVGGIAVLAKVLLTPLIIGAVILITMYRQRGLVVLVYPTGLLRLRRGEVESYPWEEVAAVRLTLQRADAPETRYADDGRPTACWFETDTPTFQLWKAGLVLERTDGTEAALGPALADYPLLAETVQRRTFPFLWAVAWNKFVDGEAVAFGDLEVTATGLRHAGKRLPWRDFKEMAVAQGRLSIKKVGKWIPWLILDVGKVPNPHVLFPLVEEVRRLRAAAASAGQPHADDEKSEHDE